MNSRDIMKLLKNPMVLGAIVVGVVLIIGLWYYMTPSPPQQQNFQQDQQSQQQKQSQQPTQDSVVPEEKPTLVLFYSKGCGHCTNFLPTFERVEEILNNTGKITALKFESSSNPDILSYAQNTGLKGVPEVRFYQEGFPTEKFVVYHGDRTEDSVLKFAYSGGKQM